MYTTVLLALRLVLLTLGCLLSDLFPCDFMQLEYLPDFKKENLDTMINSNTSKERLVVIGNYKKKPCMCVQIFRLHSIFMRKRTQIKQKANRKIFKT